MLQGIRLTTSLEFNSGKKEEEYSRYVVLFIDNENDENVHAEEVEEIDLFKILLYLNHGGSIFISNRKHREEGESCSHSDCREQMLG